MYRRNILFTPTINTITFSPTTTVSTSKKINPTILSSSVLSSIDDAISIFTSTHVASVAVLSMLPYSTNVMTSSFTSLVLKETPSSLLIESTAMTPSITVADIPSCLLMTSSTGFTSPSETSLVSHLVTMVTPAKTPSKAIFMVTDQI